MFSHNDEIVSSRLRYNGYGMTWPVLKREIRFLFHGTLNVADI